MDANNLVQSVPPQFYQELFRYIDANAKETGYSVDLHFLEELFKLTAAGKNDLTFHFLHNLKYILGF